MTINQAHNYIKLELDKTSSLELPAFEPEEIDYWLDDAILSFVKIRYSGNNVKGESFEQSQKRVEDLRLLLVEDNITSPGSPTYYDNSVSFVLPDDYFLSIREAAKVIYNEVQSTVPIEPINHDKVNQKLLDPFSEHNVRLGRMQPLRLFVEDEVILIGDGNYTISSLDITYIKSPMKVSLSPTGESGTADRALDYPELSDSSMQEVIKLATTRMLENIESPRTQSHAALSSQTE